MKRIVAVMLALALVVSAGAALAMEETDLGWWRTIFASGWRERFPESEEGAHALPENVPKGYTRASTMVFEGGVLELTLFRADENAPFTYVRVMVDPARMSETQKAEEGLALILLQEATAEAMYATSVVAGTEYYMDSLNALSQYLAVMMTQAEDGRSHDALPLEPEGSMMDVSMVESPEDGKLYAEIMLYMTE